MISANNLWIEAHNRNILAETDVEITCGLATSPSAVSTVDPTNPANFSEPDLMFESANGDTYYVYPTLERNMWLLAGRNVINPRDGYVNDGSTEAGVKVTLESATTSPIPGITINWGAESAGFATDFTITAEKNGVVVATTTINNNNSSISTVDLEIDSYDSLSIDILGWSLPERRARIRQIVLGQQIVFNKDNIINYEHEQIGHPNSGEIPQNRIRFVLDNRDNFWDPLNEVGTARYLAEQLPVSVRYGIHTGSFMSWIDAGKFSLGEWKVSSDGASISFSARDCFEFLQNLTPDTTYNASLGYHAVHALSRAKEAGALSSFNVADPMFQYEAIIPVQSVTEAEVVQMCANAACCIIAFSRDGNRVEVRPVEAPKLEYTIPLKLAYSYPEISLSKPLKAVSVSYGENQQYILEVRESGETQTVFNSFVSTEEQAQKIAVWVKNTLESRKRVRGEFRADPRLDLFDVVTVETKHGTLYPVLLTYIKYTYTGAFKTNYEGYVISLQEEA